MIKTTFFFDEKQRVNLLFFSSYYEYICLYIKQYSGSLVVRKEYAYPL